MSIFQILLDKISNYPKCLIKGNQALEGRELDRAHKYYQKVIKRLGKRDNLNSTQKRYLGEAFLGQGNVYVARIDKDAAFESYNEAINNSIQIPNLSAEAINLLGATFSNKKDQGDRAIEIYLRCIEIETSDTVTKKIYAILEQLCFVDEAQDPHNRKKSILLNQKIVSINKNIDWPHYYLGVGAYLENDKSTAEKHLLNSVKFNEKRALTYYWLGRTFDDSKESETAVKHFLKFTELVSDNEELLKQAEAYSFLGTALIQRLGGFPDAFDKTNREKLEQAASFFEKSSIKNARNDGVFFNLARTFACLSNHQEAIEAYKKAITINNRNGEYFYLLAIELKKIKSYGDAIKNVTAALSVDDQDKYRLLLSELYLIKENYSRSETECFKVYEKNNENVPYAFCILTYALYHQTKYANITDLCEKYQGKLTFNKTYPDVYYFIARAYSNVDQFTKATEWYIRSIEIIERADAVYYLGCALAHKEDYEKALTAFKRCINRETEFKALAYLQCGIIYFKLNQLKDAEDNYIKAYSIDSKNIRILYSVGLFYYLQGENEKALNYLSELLAIDTNHSAARFIQGHIYEKKGNIPSAITEYDSLSSDTGVGLLSLLRLGIIYFKQTDYKKTFKYLQQAYQSEDKTDALLFYYGLVCALINKFESALKSWNVLIDRHPEDERLRVNIYRVHYLFGSRYANENKLQQAIQEWKEYLKGYTNDTKMKKNLAQLYFRLFAAEIGKGDFEKAKNYLLEASSLDKDNSKYIYYAALCDYKSGRFDECLHQLSTLLDKDPASLRIKYHKGVALMRKGDKTQGKDILREVSNANENNEYVFHAKWLIANEYILNSEYEKAIPILEALSC